jgi:hypothetical protein
MQRDIKKSNAFKLAGGLALGYGVYKVVKAKREKKQISKVDAFVITGGLFALMIGFIGLNKV